MNARFLIFSILLYSACSKSPKKETLHSAYPNSTLLLPGSGTLKASFNNLADNHKMFCKKYHSILISDYDDLSYKLEFEVAAFQAGDEENTQIIYKLNVQVVNKQQKKTIQEINIIPEFMFPNIKESGDGRSYSTGKGIKKEVVDNDFGSFVVADFNFDNQDDFAIKTTEGGNGGPCYTYFIQSNDGSFKSDTFLTNQMMYFPIHIDKKKMRLTNSVHASAYGVCENVYQYHPYKKEWQLVNQTYVGLEMVNGKWVEVRKPFSDYLK